MWKYFVIAYTYDANNKEFPIPYKRLYEKKSKVEFLSIKDVNTRLDEHMMTLSMALLRKLIQFMIL